MNYYERHLGDYARDTGHLSPLEHGVYTLLLDRYYATEKPIPESDAYRICRARTKDERAAVDIVLAEFFRLEDGLFRNKKADRIIEEFLLGETERTAEKENAKERQRRARERRKALFDELRALGKVPAWDTTTAELEDLLSRSKSQPVTQPVTRDNTANQTPDTSNHKEDQKQKRVQPLAARSRFSEFWAVYPNKKGRQEAEKSWNKRKLDPVCDYLIAHVGLMSTSDDDWLRGYIPMGSTYLNQARWEDVPKQPARAGPAVVPQSKTLTAIQTLQSMKSDGNVDTRRDSGRPEQVALLGTGTYSGR